MSESQEGSQKKGTVGLWQYALLVAAGAFATTFAQTRMIGNLPTTFLLKNEYQLPKEDVAFFFFWATFAWNLKPVAGILTDAFPLFGTRRRHYMMLGATIAGIMWVVMGTFGHQYGALLGASIGMNIATVFSSTVMGGMMVEAGQAYGAPGRISSLRQVVQSVATVIAPTLGGYLAGKTFFGDPGVSGFTVATSIGAATVFTLALLTFFVLKEKGASASDPVVELDPNRPRFKPGPAVLGGVAALLSLAIFLTTTDLRNVGISLIALSAVFLIIIALAVVPTENKVIARAQTQLSQIFESRTLWMAVVMLFLVYTVPGLNTALVYQQSDVLKFEPDFIGNLGSVEGMVGIAAAFFYAAFCRRFNLRTLLIGGVGLSALSTYLFLIYSQETAVLVHGCAGFFGIVAELALMDLAVRSTPKGCEALGFSLMMSIRNFGISMSDVLGTQIMDTYSISFQTMVIVNGTTTLLVLMFVPFLPKGVIVRKEGEALG